MSPGRVCDPKGQSRNETCAFTVSFRCRSFQLAVYGGLVVVCMIAFSFSPAMTDATTPNSPLMCHSRSGRSDDRHHTTHVAPTMHAGINIRISNSKRRNICDMLRRNQTWRKSMTGPWRVSHLRPSHFVPQKVDAAEGHHAVSVVGFDPDCGIAGGADADFVAVGVGDG